MILNERGDRAMTGVGVKASPSTWGCSLLIAALMQWFLLSVSSASAAVPGLWIEHGPIPAASAELLQFSDALAKLAERLRPSVVQVGVIDNQDESLELPLGHPPVPPERPRVGSGFIIHPDGYVITNQHVVRRSGRIEVELFGGEKALGTVIGRDARTDLALLKIDPPRALTALALGDSDTLKVGELVLAIGNPFGLDYSVTMGVVSRKGRALGADGPFDEYIQTDAAINPGNSGGPLLNLRGEVVGINTATVPNRRVGFAIPINLAKTLLPELKEHGKIRWGFLGVTIQELTATLAQALGVEGTKGVLVNGVVPKGPAERAGLRPGDIITGFDGMTIDNVRDLQRKVGRTPIGQTSVVKIIRKGTTEEIPIQVGELPQQTVASAEPPRKDLGFTVEMLDQDKAKKFKLKEDEGLVVTDVVKNGPGAQAGLQPGDLIKEVNQQPVSSLEEYRRSLGESMKGRIDLLLIQRGEAVFYVAVRSKG
jgi:serine protease Do